MPDTPVDRPNPPAYDPDHEVRISRLEDDVRDGKATLAQMVPMLVRIDSMLTATLPHLATKAEFAELRAEVKSDIAGLRTEVKSDIAGLRTEVKSDLAELRAESRSDLGGLRAQVNSDVGGLRTVVKSDTSAIIATLAHLATKAELAEKPSKAYLWGVLAALIAAYATGLAGLAILLR
ncbi:MAG TPA: hypothetical protein VND19_02825 [Acetobacteraceae bacterium]|nr:hypothetical protein [Acetobacteraceae bacterium]